MFHLLRNLLHGWEIKQGIVTPVLANLITAAVLFSGAILFKEPIYDLLQPPKAEDFPLYVVPEPHGNAQGLLEVDLFIINLRGKGKTRSDLVELLRPQAIQQGRTIDPDIHLVWKSGFRGRITRVVPDEEFNRDKGRLELKQEENGEWRISVNEISGKGIMMLKVETNRKVREIGRAAKTSVPFEYRYPGE